MVRTLPAFSLIILSWKLLRQVQGLCSAQDKEPLGSEASWYSVIFVINPTISTLYGEDQLVMFLVTEKL